MLFISMFSAFCRVTHRIAKPVIKPAVGEIREIPKRKELLSDW